MRTTRDAGVRSPTLIVLDAAAGKGTVQIAEAVGLNPSAVLKVLHRFRAERKGGLRDHREDNGHVAAPPFCTVSRSISTSTVRTLRPK
jgi:Winged helix-turn helix